MAIAYENNTIEKKKVLLRTNNQRRLCQICIEIAVEDQISRELGKSEKIHKRRYKKSTAAP